MKRPTPSGRVPVHRGGGGPNFGPLAVEPRPPTKFSRRRNWGNFFTPGRLTQEGLWLALWSEISSRGACPIGGMAISAPAASGGPSRGGRARPRPRRKVEGSVQKPGVGGRAQTRTELVFGAWAAGLRRCGPVSSSAAKTGRRALTTYDAPNACVRDEGGAEASEITCPV